MLTSPLFADFNTMSRQFSMIQPSTSAESDVVSSALETIRTKCIFCQEITSVPLIEPLRNTGIGYKTVANLLQLAQEKGYNPFMIKIDFRRLDDCSGIEKTLILKAAVWCRSCRNKPSEYKIERYASAKNELLHQAKALAWQKHVDVALILNQVRVSQK